MKRKPLSDAHKAALSAALKGHKASPETRDKISASLKGRTYPSRVGKPLSAEHKAKLSAIMTGRKSSPEAIAKMRAAKAGKPMTPEARAAQSEARRLLWEDPEYRAKTAAAIKAGMQRPETKAKLSAARARMEASPEYKANQSKWGTKGGEIMAARNWADPEFRKRRSLDQAERMRALWDDPVWKAKQMQARLEREALRRAGQLPVQPKKPKKPKKDRIWPAAPMTPEQEARREARQKIARSKREVASAKRELERQLRKDKSW